ncbi:MAG: AarF/ABC1/UbiB kinase family protein [Phycisphaeraceae bacterium]|nr:AarF/ABC1/UbiB kinase family protein [Phycisphaeraceae bacterium]
MLTKILDIPHTLRSSRRFAEIVATLARFGLDDAVAELGLNRMLAAPLELVGIKREERAKAMPRSVRLRLVLETLGPTFIKLGQVLSTRPDLIPPEWAEEFKKLQDDAPKLDFKVIRERLEQQFPGQVDALFPWIDHVALAAASMAQIHRARLADGTEVVLKVLRPGIESLTESDMDVLRTLAGLLEGHFSNLGYSPSEVVSEFAAELRKEVDLIHEGHATDRLREAFADDPGVAFPRVYWGATTRAVLAVEEFHGTLLSELEEGDLTPHERHLIVKHGATALLRQCLELGFFHADPHPGNLFALPRGRIGFIDCGMTGWLDDRTMVALADLVGGVTQGDLNKVIRVVAELGDAEWTVLESRSFRADVREFVAHFQTSSLGRLNMGAMLREFFEKLREHHIRCPGDLVLLIKALSTIETVAAELDPSFDLVAAARPFVEKLARRRYGVKAIRQRMTNAAVAYAELAEQIPGEIRHLTRQLKRNRFQIHLDHLGLDKFSRTVEHASRNVAAAVTVAAVIVASAIILRAEAQTIGWAFGTIARVGFLIGIVLAVVIVVRNWRVKDY